MFTKLVGLFISFIIINILITIMVNFLIDFFGNGLVLIVYMLENQAKLLQQLECFQIDLSFKHVKGDLNEFEINLYDNSHKLSKYIFFLKI